MIVRRHGGARRILSLELLGFMNLLSPASLYSRVNRWLLAGTKDVRRMDSWYISCGLTSLEEELLSRSNFFHRSSSCLSSVFFFFLVKLSREETNLITAWPIEKEWRQTLAGHNFSINHLSGPANETNQETNEFPKEKKIEFVCPWKWFVSFFLDQRLRISFISFSWCNRWSTRKRKIRSRNRLMVSG